MTKSQEDKIINSMLYKGWEKFPFKDPDYRHWTTNDLRKAMREYYKLKTPTKPKTK